MADQNNVAALLAALTGGAAQRPAGAPGSAQMPPGYGLPVGLNPSAPQPALGGIGSPPTNFALPKPSSSGSLDLSKIKPTVSGKVQLEDALAKAKARAQEMGARPAGSRGYDDSRGHYGRGRSRSRSRSPPRRGGDPYRDAYSTFRDERRGRNNDYRRDRSISPPPTRGSRSGYSPPPRDRYGQPAAAGGSTRQRSPAPDMEQINIDASLVGLIIGRGGENLRRVEAETGARVQFMTNGHDRDSGGERVCNIQGNRQQIAAARHAIESIIAENEKNGGSGPPSRSRGGQGGGSNAGGGAGGGAPNLRDGEESTQIYVPDRTVGLIIGRGGETIRDIQDKSGCHVNIVGEAKSQNGQRPVNLIGSPAASEHAKRLIMEIVESDTNGGPPARGPEARVHSQQPSFYGGGAPGGVPAAGGDRVTETMRVPIDAVGMIIGKGGETIKDMQNTTGCRINVSSQFNPNDQEREISLAGSRDAIARARDAIAEKVEASLNKSRSSNPSSRYSAGPSHSAPAHHQPGADWSSAAAAAYNPAPSTSPTPAAGADDPYAAYGGYQNYCAMYYAAMMQQQAAQQQGGAAGGAGAAPGT